MKVRLDVTAVLTNPDEGYTDAVLAVAEGQRELDAAPMQLLHAISIAGGLIREIDGRKEIEFIPLCRVKSIVVKASSILTVDPLEAAHLGAIPGGRG